LLSLEFIGGILHLLIFNFRQIMDLSGNFSSELESPQEGLRQRFDTSVAIGIVMGFSLILGALLISGNLLNFFDPLGILIVVGGTLASTMIQFSLSDIIQAFTQAKSALYQNNSSPLERILYFVELARESRKRGMLILDKAANQSSDLFLAKALEMTVDGTDSEMIRRILENEVRIQSEKQARSIAVFQTMASYAPAFGLIGTLIGLVGLLGALNSPEAVGPAMSVALMTTLYGALIANLICLPMAGKLRTICEEAALIRTITVEGTLCLAANENPLIVEQKLQSFLPS
jgi:chemotaxis protein MotA